MPVPGFTAEASVCRYNIFDLAASLGGAARTSHSVMRRARDSQPAIQPQQCLYYATVTNGECYNIDGTVSEILTPGTLYGDGCGPTLDAARNFALRALSGQACLTTPAERQPGCCTYQFLG